MTAQLMKRTFRLCLTFALLRLAEACLLILALIVVSDIEAAITRGLKWVRSSYGGLYGAWIGVRTYYFIFGYFYFSAIVFLLVGLIRGMDNQRVLVAANFGAFAAHSAAVIVFIFEGHIGLVLWIVWLLAALLNWILPRLFWRTVLTRPVES
jgi:hypothetical protein